MSFLCSLYVNTYLYTVYACLTYSCKSVHLQPVYKVKFTIHFINIAAFRYQQNSIGQTHLQVICSIENNPLLYLLNFIYKNKVFGKLWDPPVLVHDVIKTDSYY